MLGDLLLDAAIIAHSDRSETAVVQLLSYLAVLVRLHRLIMHRAVAENTNVRRIEEIRDTGEPRNRLLRFVGQAMVPGGQGIEKAPLQCRAGIGQRAQPQEV